MNDIDLNNTKINVRENLSICTERFKVLKEICENSEFLKILCEQNPKEIHKLVSIQNRNIIFLNNICDEDDEELQVFAFYSRLEINSDNVLIFHFTQIEDEEQIEELLDLSKIDQDRCNILDVSYIRIEMTNTHFEITVNINRTISSVLQTIFSKIFKNLIVNMQSYIIEF